MAEQLEEEDVDTQEAFDTLLQQLRQALSEAQEEGGQAFKESRFDDARAAAKRGEEIKSRIEKLKELQRGWSTLIHDSDLTTPQVERIPRGVKTPQQDFWLPILTALEQMGGSGRTREVIDRVEPIVKDRLHEVDWATLSDGRSIRWRNTTQWARYKMVQAGLLASDSPRGVWEITEAGRAYLREHRQKSANSQERNHESTG